MSDIDNAPEVIAARLQAARRHQITTIYDRLPKRKTGEMGQLVALIDASNETLKLYDALPADQQPAVAEYTLATFTAALSRLGEIVDAREAAEAEKASKRAAKS